MIKALRFGEKRSFVREARALGKVRGTEGLQHLEAVVLDGRDLKIVSRYAGPTLRHCLARDLLSSKHLDDVHEQVLAGLQRMHQAGVTHGDLHPENVCVTMGSTRLHAAIIDMGFSTFRGEPSFKKEKQKDMDDFAFLLKETTELFRGSSGSSDADEDELDWEDRFASDGEEEGEKP